MKTSLGTKKKIYSVLYGIMHPVTMMCTAALGIALIFMPNMYRGVTQPEAEAKEQQAEFDALAKRVQGIEPMRKYVATLQEQAAVVLKLPADALPAGTDTVKLQAQGDKLSAAYNAEVRDTAFAIAFAAKISYTQVGELGTRLNVAAGRKLDYVIPQQNSGSGSPLKHFRDCQAEITGQKGFVPSEAAVTQLKECVSAKRAPFIKAVYGGMGGFFGVMVLSIVFSGRLRRSIKAEEEAAEAAGLQPVAEAEPINTATGQDITVKPIKITAKTPGVIA